MTAPHARLFLASFATLFVEILLIRWIGTEVRVFAYFQNLALLACFLGFGLGCYHAGRNRRVAVSMLALSGLVVLVRAPSARWQKLLADLSNLLGFSYDNVLWMADRDLGLPAWMGTAVSVGVLTLLLLLLVLTMIPLGQWVGHLLDNVADPIRGYSVNLVGSLAGIVAFAGLSFLRSPPVVWFAIAILSMTLIARPRRGAMSGITAAIASIAVIGLTLAFGPDEGLKTYWSPYQKLTLRPIGGEDYQVAVNNSAYMALNDMRADRFRNTPAAGGYVASPYNSPLYFARRLDRVLVVGSGGGNDVAGALRAGAKQIDAVEIDPVILEIGERLHPEQPYSSPRVRKVVNDARAWFRQSQDRYDAIIFGLLDSHTHLSGYSNMRIDNYVYTEESFREARALLAPDGVLILKFEVRRPWTWMGDRFHATLTRVFGRPPVTYYAPAVGRATSATVFIASNDPDLWTRAATGDLAQLIELGPPEFTPGAEPYAEPTTDDWPYIYQRVREIPRTYVTVSIVLLALALLLVRRTFEPRRMSTWRFFFLGAGFLLMETQMMNRLALFFGTTWVVSSVVISAILAVLVLANLFVARVQQRALAPWFAALVVSLAAIYAFPWSSHAWSAHAVGALLSAAYCVPVFLAGVIFAESFRRETVKSSVFGANIFGSVAGGLAQNLSLIFGMRSLLLVAAVTYVLAAAATIANRGSSR